MAIDIAPPADAIFASRQRQVREPLEPLLGHATWWLRASPIPNEDDVFGREAEYLITQLSYRAIGGERDRRATADVLQAAMDQAADLNAKLDKERQAKADVMVENARLREENARLPEEIARRQRRGVA